MCRDPKAFRECVCNVLLTLQVSHSTRPGATGRSFTLKMDNGFEFVARFPFPCAGPRKLLVQSEAATLDFLGNHFGLPVPRVAAYNSSSDKSINAVGAPYILQAKLPGRELTEDEDAAKAGPFLDELVNLQAVLSSIPFAQHGSLYYVSDVDEELRQRPLFKEMEGFEPADETLERFRIGPSVARNFYRGDRAMLDLDRGPCMCFRRVYLCAAHVQQGPTTRRTSAP